MASRLLVAVREGRALAAADRNGFSDPYFVARLKAENEKHAESASGSYTCKHLKKTLDPAWNEKFVLPTASAAERALSTVKKGGKKVVEKSKNLKKSGGRKPQQNAITEKFDEDRLRQDLIADGASAVDVFEFPFLSIEVWDHDRVTKDDFLGRCFIRIDNLREKQVVSGWYKLEGTKTGEVFVEVEVVRARDKTTAYKFAQSIREKLRGTDQLWEDPEFPATAASLYKVKKAEPSIEWLRPKEMAGVEASKVSLFLDGVEAGDVKQQALGDCYFLGAAAVIATRKELLLPLFFSHQPELGFYQCKFWKNGRWQIVTVDDRFPCKNGYLMYGRCRDKNEFWVAVIEKAFAKLHGCYEAIESGSIAQALTDMTGESAQLFEWGAHADIKDGPPSWDTLLEWRKEEFLLGCSNSASGQAAETESDSKLGILVNHAYSVLDAKEAEGKRFVKVRNPWGSTEWKGAYSDNSKEWTPSLQAALKAVFEDDGTWWMLYEDFVAQYNHMQVLRLLTDTVGKKWHVRRFALEWSERKKTAGGSTNHSTWHDNPQIALELHDKAGGLAGMLGKAASDSKVFIAVSQPDGRMEWKDRYENGLGCYIMETEDNTRPKMAYKQEDIVAKMTFVTTRDVVLEAILTPGKKYVAIPCTYDAHKESMFWVTVFSEHRISATLIGAEPETTVKSTWTSSTAGGCRNHPSWVKNPVFTVELLDTELAENETMSITVVLKQPDVDHANLKFIGMYGGAWKDGAQIDKFQKSDCIYEVQCVNTIESTLTIDAKAADLPFWIMPLTFEPGQGDFELQVRAPVKVTIKDARTGQLLA